MTTALTGELCRITVIGPERRVDLAVPSGTPVATLLPVLLRHTTAMGRHAEADAPEGAWVLQRLGQEPFELTGTPETLDLLEGEELYLRPADNPLPELDFDDLADGVATVVNRRSDRWQPEYRRTMFLVLSVVSLGLLAAVLVARGPVLAQVIGTGVLSGVFLIIALLAARMMSDSTLSLLFGYASAAYAALAASSAVDGAPDGIAVTERALTWAAVGIAVVTALLLLAQRTITPALPVAPLLVGAVTALVVVGVLVLHTSMGMTAQRASASAAVVVFVAIVFAPKAAVKISRLRGPQLPKTGEEMSFDIEPASSDLVRKRALEADTYLTVTMIASALVLPVLFHFVMEVPIWAGWTLVVVLSSAILLRARTFMGVWQRTALVSAGTAGYVMVVMMWSDTVATGSWIALLSALTVLVVPLVFAALRPWPRRMLPFWEYTATFLDVVTGLAVLPLLAQILGLYAWARGLFG